MSNPSYIYKVYRNGAFAGTLDNVVSEFNYSQPINSAGVNIEVELAVSFADVGAGFSEDALLVSHDGSHLITETGGKILINKNLLFSNFAIEPGNRLEVLLFTDEDPDGSTAFDGIITGVIPDFQNNKTKIRALSYGYELDNYIINTGSSLVADQSQTDGTLETYFYGATRMLGQSFIPDVSPISGVVLKLDAANLPANAQVTLHTNNGGSPSASPISSEATATREISSNSMTETTFTFISPITVTPGTTYWIVLQ